MRVLSAQEIQHVSGSASTAATAKATTSSYNLSELFTVFLVGIYLLVTGKSLTSLI